MGRTKPQNGAAWLKSMGISFKCLTRFLLIFIAGAMVSNDMLMGSREQRTGLRSSTGSVLSSSIRSDGSIDCSLVKSIEPVSLGRMVHKEDDDDDNSTTTATFQEDVPSYFVSYAWFDKRAKFLQRNRTVHAPSDVVKIHNLLRNTTKGSALVDIGANVGFMTHFAPSLQRPVFAVEPLEYDIAKICEAQRANQQDGLSQPELFHLYRAVAGPKPQKEVLITRPTDELGKFDRASLTPTNLKRVTTKNEEMTTEGVPMITVDSIVPPDQPVGVVKIDVQGHEAGVVMGMTNLLARSEGYPKYIYYENYPRLYLGAGYEQGQVAGILAQYGYTCDDRKNALCYKFS